VQEPIMHVRISLSEKRWIGPVRRALSARRATLQEEYLGVRHAVLRYEAPLVRLVGLPAELLGLTDGSARYWIVLSHYALVTGEPDGSAA
jgi:translation elongation factor EF-G